MISVSISNAIQENHDEIMQRWLAVLHGAIGDDYEQMLKTPVGASIAGGLLSQAVEFLRVEAYEESDVLQKAKGDAREASFRRAAVGFQLHDIVTMVLAFRTALHETLLNHVTPANTDESEELLSAVLALDRLSDAIIGGEIGGYLAYNNFSSNRETDAA